MTTYTEPTRASEIILSEANGTLSRESVTIAAGAGVIPVGAVLGMVTASGHYTWYDNNQGDGTAQARCIALERVDATTTAKTCAVLARMAEIKGDLLVWADVSPEPGATAGLADLAAITIIVR